MFDATLLDGALNLFRLASLALAAPHFEELGRKVYLLGLDLVENRARKLAAEGALDLADRIARESIQGADPLACWPQSATGRIREA